MTESLSPQERIALLRILKALPGSTFAEGRIVLDVPAHVLPSGVSLGDRLPLSCRKDPSRFKSKLRKRRGYQHIPTMKQSLLIHILD